MSPPLHFTNRQVWKWNADGFSFYFLLKSRDLKALSLSKGSEVWTRGRTTGRRLLPGEDRGHGQDQEEGRCLARQDQVRPGSHESSPQWTWVQRGVHLLNYCPFSQIHNVGFRREGWAAVIDRSVLQTEPLRHSSPSKYSIFCLSVAKPTWPLSRSMEGEEGV